MTQDQLLSTIAPLAMLALVGSSLMARRLPAGTVMRLALLWLAIFAGLFLVVRAIPSLTAYFT